MNKISKFCKSNKVFVVIAVVFVMLGMVFNNKLVKLSNQAVVILAIAPKPAPVDPSPQYYIQYPSYNNSGFYLTAKISGAESYAQALKDLQIVSSSVSKDAKYAIDTYYRNCKSSPSSVVCTSNLNAVLNSLYTYATYVTTYNRFLIESKGTTMNSNIDWAGVAMSSVALTIKNSRAGTSDGVMIDLTSNLQTQFGLAGRGTFTYEAPLASTARAMLSKLLGRLVSVSAPDTSTPPVLIPSNPYIFIFGQNQLGTLDFKIIDRTSQWASPISKFESVNGTGGAGEIDTTISKLTTIGGSLYNGELAYAELLMGIIKSISATPISTTDTCADEGASGSGATSAARCDIMNGMPGFQNSTVTCSPAPRADASVSTNFSSIARLERKMVQYANNKPSAGVAAQGETGVLAVELTNGQVLAGFTSGIQGTFIVVYPISYLANTILKYKGKIKNIYNEHVHDINTCRVINQVCFDDKGNEMPLPLTAPGIIDLKTSIVLENEIELNFISRVFSPNGTGIEYSVPNISPWYQVIDNFPTSQKSRDIAACTEGIIYRATERNMISKGRRSPISEDWVVGYGTYIAKLIEKGVSIKKIKAGF